MKSYEHIMKLHEISYNFYFTHNEIDSNHNVFNTLYTILIIVYKIEDFDCYAYTPIGGNLCKYAHHIIIKLTK